VSKKEESPALAGKDIGAPAPQSERAAIEKWAKKNGTPDWLFAATKALLGGIEGFETTEAGYLAACQHTLNQPCGYTSQGIGTARSAHAATDPTDPKAVAAYAAKHIRRGAK
jgi:hypothetical protein